MVRFIIYLSFVLFLLYLLFTFQYGQIYYKVPESHFKSTERIYIPIWLDLLLLESPLVRPIVVYLHSNMVRFIIIGIPIGSPNSCLFTFQYGQIYYKTILQQGFHSNNYLHSNMVRFIIFSPPPLSVYVLHLHSNMVRFIIMMKIALNTIYREFTFQYGQIYYFTGKSFWTVFSKIYIPIWLDLLYKKLDYQK